MRLWFRQPVQTVEEVGSTFTCFSKFTKHTIERGNYQTKRSLQKTREEVYISCPTLNLKSHPVRATSTRIRNSWGVPERPLKSWAESHFLQGLGGLLQASKHTIHQMILGWDQHSSTLQFLVFAHRKSKELVWTIVVCFWIPVVISSLRFCLSILWSAWFTDVCCRS